jgi:stage III sporulation protein AB
MFYSHRLYRRADWLREAERLLDALLARLTYTAQPLATLWLAMEASEVFSRYPLVQGTAAGLRQGHAFAAAFGAALEHAAGQGLLQPPEKQLLFELAAALGQTGLTQHEACIRHCLAQLSEARRVAERLAAARGQVYQMMGVAGGVSLALLLL